MGDEIDFQTGSRNGFANYPERFPQLHMRTAAVFYRDSTDEYDPLPFFQDDPG